MKVNFKCNDEERVIDLENENICNELDIEIRKDNIVRKRRISSKLTAVTPLLCVVTYLAIGFLKGIWHPTWVIFLLIPIVPIFCDVFTKKGKGQVMALITMLVVIGYIILGIFGFWHPGWLIFFLIPICSILL